MMEQDETAKKLKVQPDGTVEKVDMTAKDMEKDLEIDHHTRMDFVVTFKNRYQALECWSAIKKILEAFEVNAQTQGVMMETLSCLAEHIDMDVRKEAIEKGLVEPDPERAPKEENIYDRPEGSPQVEGYDPGHQYPDVVDTQAGETFEEAANERNKPEFVD